jgi:integrin beta 3
VPGPAGGTPGGGPAGTAPAARASVVPPVRPGVAAPPDGRGDDPVQSRQPDADSPSRRTMSDRRKLAAVAAAVLLVFGALPVYFGVSALARDPVFDSLDSLDVPAWAAVDPEDQVGGNPWCVIDCRIRERTVESERGWEETAQVYEQALTAGGWRPWQVELCPGQPVEGRYSCWRRDELTLDLWVRERPCPTGPEASPSGAAEAADGTPGAEGEPAECGGSLVTLKVRNAIDDDRNRPEPSIDPSRVGETPDPVFTDDPLNPSSS